MLGNGGISGQLWASWAYLGPPISPKRQSVGCRVTLNTMRTLQSFLNASYRHGLLLYKFLKMENLKDPKFLEISTATLRLRNPPRNSCFSLHCADGETEAQGADGTHQSPQKVPWETDRPDPPILLTGKQVWQMGRHSHSLKWYHGPRPA